MTTSEPDETAVTGEVGDGVLTQGAHAPGTTPATDVVHDDGPDQSATAAARSAEQGGAHDPDESPDDALPDAPDEPERPAEPTWRRFDCRADADEAIAAAVAAVKAGECIVLPTDTVYGIGVNAFDAAAVQRLLDAKQRGRDFPPPVLIADTAMLGSLVQYIDGEAENLAAKWWPGPLTMIFRAQDSLRMDLGDTRGTIAVRVPDHEFTRRLLRRTGPLAVSSANVHGQPASTSVDIAIEQLGNSVAVYLDDGPTPGDQPSSIVDFSANTLGQLVRAGAIGLAELQEVSAYLSWSDPADEPDLTEDGLAEAADEQAAPLGEVPEGGEGLAEQVADAEANGASSSHGSAGTGLPTPDRPTPIVVDSMDLPTMGQSPSA